MDVLSEGLDFCRLVSGSPSPALMVVLLYVCQACGWCPKFDYDYWVLDTCGQARVWYCARCGVRYCQTMMNGAIAVCLNDKKKKQDGLIARITIPNGKLMNMVTFLQFFKCMRSGNMSIANGSLKLIAELTKDFKYMIMRDNRTACKAVKSVGAMQKFHK